MGFLFRNRYAGHSTRSNPLPNKKWVESETNNAALQTQTSTPIRGDDQHSRAPPDRCRFHVKTPATVSSYYWRRPASPPRRPQHAVAQFCSSRRRRRYARSLVFGPLSPPASASLGRARESKSRVVSAGSVVGDFPDRRHRFGKSGSFERLCVARCRKHPSGGNVWKLG